VPRDLHLGNIRLIDHKPMLSIDRVRSGDGVDRVLYDLAFPAMEFLHYRRDSARHLLLNRY